MSEGYKMTDIGEISNDWEVVKLGDVIKLSSGNGLVRANSIEGRFPVYGGNGISFYNSNYTHEISQIIIGRVGAYCGCVHKTTSHCWITDNALFIREKLRKYDDDFLFYILNKLDLNSYANKNAQPVISGQKIYSIQIGFPPLPEQQKIAEILTTVDEKIDIINTQIIQTQELKKGLMQQLLIRGIGHTKFKESELGEIPESWEVVKIGDITQIKVGKDLIEKNYSLYKTLDYQYPVYSNTVSDKGLYGYYNIIEHNGKSVTVVGRGVGVGTCFPRIGIFGAIGRLLVLFPNLNLDEKYLSYYINFSVKFFIESSAIPQLTGTQIAQYNIALPELSEQQKIASILNGVDDKLDILEMKKKSFVELKKGLMQQLLTGKIRVK